MVNTPSSSRRRGACTPRPCSAATTPSPEVIHSHDVVEHHDVVVHHDHVSLLGRLVDFDHRASAWVQEQSLWIFLRTLEFSGTGVFLIPCTAAAFLAPPQKLTPEVRMFFFNLFMTFIFDLIFVSIVKKIVRAHAQFHSTRALITTTLFALYLPMWQDQSRRIWTPFLVNQLKGHVIVLKNSMHIAESLLISAIAFLITAWAVATTILGRHDVLAGSVIGIGEALFAHRYLFIPMRTSEYIHSAVNQSFAWIEDSIYNSFQSGTFVITHVKPR